jgi:hypothetical protein
MAPLSPRHPRISVTAITPLQIGETAMEKASAVRLLLTGFLLLPGGLFATPLTPQAAVAVEMLIDTC